MKLSDSEDTSVSRVLWSVGLLYMQVFWVHKGLSQCVHVTVVSTLLNSIPFQLTIFCSTL